MVLVTRRSKRVDVLDEFSEAEGLPAESDAGLEALEAARDDTVGGEDGGGENDLRGVARDLEEFVDAVALCEVGFKMAEKVSMFGG